MKRTVKAARGAPWVTRIPLNDGVMSDSLPCVRYLLDEAKVETLNVKTDGYFPLQLAIIWGKPHIMVYLFTRGAERVLDGESVVDMARLRQQRLQEAFERAGDGVEFENFSITKARIEPLLEEGSEMLQILEGIEAAGSYLTWAHNNGTHPLVRRFSREIRSSAPRYELCVLRALVLAERASLLPEAERAVMEAEEAAQAAARAKEEQPLLDVLVEEGFSADAAKELRDAFRKPTLKALRAAKLSSEEIEAALEAPVRQRRMTEGDKRKFARFVRELDLPPTSRPSSAAGAAAAAKAPAAAKSKAKAVPPAAKAALLAMSSAKAKGAAQGKAKAAPAPAAARPKKASATDGMALLFNEGLPENAFMLMACFLIGI